MGRPEHGACPADVATESFPRDLHETRERRGMDSRQAERCVQRQSGSEERDMLEKPKAGGLAWDTEREAGRPKSGGGGGAQTPGAGKWSGKM